MVTGERKEACIEGRRCDGPELQLCSNGTWLPEQACEHGCDPATFSCNPPPREPECEPGAKRCLSSRLEACQNGFWDEVETCPEGCSGDECRSGTNFTLFFLLVTFAVASTLSAVVFFAVKDRLE
jgi:hypothetical protein